MTHNEQQLKSQLSDHLIRKPNLPPMNCSKCRRNVIECSCVNGLGQWWNNLQKKSESVSFDLSSIKHANVPQKKLFVLLDWNNRQSLLDFIRTIKPDKNLSNFTIEQLRELILNHDNIYICTSIIDLILNKQNHSCYIDPFYYSAIEGTIPMLQSQLIADNINLTRALFGIETVANLLGVKIDQEPISRKNRSSILQKQSLFIASKIPYYTFRNPSILF